MKAIGFDCANKIMRVCAFNDNKKFVVEKNACSGTDSLLPAIDECLKNVGLSIDKVENLVVGVGPGSWTGARVAVATALGLFAGHSKLKLYSFNTFEMIQLFCKTNNIIVEAYADFVFFLENGEKMQCMTKSDAQNYANNGNVVAGETSLLTEQEIVKVDFEKFIEYWLKNKSTVDVSDLEPMYLKLSQAEEQLIKRMKTK